MKRKDRPLLKKHNEKQKKGDVSMALLAAPIETAICVNDEGAAKLQKKNTVILDALRKIRKLESPKGDAERLRRLDSRIEILRDSAERDKT